MDNDKAYILHILDEIENINNFLGNINFVAFIGDIKTSKAVERSLEIIGEAAKNLSEEFKENNKQIPWRDVAGLRDKIIHHYFDVDYQTIWDIVQKDLPELKEILTKYK
ncbi:hypothetical protein A2643_03700 [Candidatus Nomurabacteria bacterium RIFCSPHIGHO2_01_FULL_39_220]|uniref:DUF86 domain-containing protein n=1 Tax=Candidatus Nomurabacteria bacterium RIFCSPLOWO2_02_FULL_40_67 TaxID=1801787 RepID=A0A1F6Y4P8_9BACT|nr:MAG: hypothetical protein UU71_C0035G0011 [Parcubacteria group bacterium GW2011_GWB1_41_6]KKS72012.1 MAG: hypothetical protein UV43_C0023G0002 [Parcubacteria group bacterium GW2011_GWF2_42_7]OGI62335.1 MAG: hypothetical protein A2W12_03850 [Candidatus Nomurabacteria bacterium RBG_16_40_11]OGI70722.1 MAG: hypothetical protein A2643_03700 [Candidatus Nomurabacteria bacterium RIFCSPHIGHO2_01_FULL_39_220]OGI72901.1 MAG: hypothetical protein A2W56_04010 [Candidatus Nomurabacteria bacterium RIFCSP